MVMVNFGSIRCLAMPFCMRSNVRPPTPWATSSARWPGQRRRGPYCFARLVAALLVAFQLLEPRVGVSNAVALISVACLLVGLFCLSLPDRIDRAQREQAKASSSASPVATTAAAIDDEAKQAVDYFGAVRVVGAAFLFGLGAARKLKR